MKFKRLSCAALLIVVLTDSGGNFASALVPILAQGDPTVTKDEREKVQRFAKLFIAQMLKSRNVGPLIAKFFLRDFTDLSKQDFYEKVSPALYSKLSRREKVRLFAAQENLGYIITLDVMMQPDSQVGANRPFEKILPRPIARRLSLSRLLEGTAEFVNREEFLNELIYLEKALIEARPFLRRKNIEQSAAFVSRLKSFEQDPYLGYRVRAALVDQDTKLELGSPRLPVGQKIFFCDTPILIGIVLMKEGGKLKILTLTPADSD